jgi:hypothetical protein
MWAPILALLIAGPLWKGMLFCRSVYLGEMAAEGLYLLHCFLDEFLIPDACNPRQLVV